MVRKRINGKKSERKIETITHEVINIQNKHIYKILFIRTAKVSRMNLQRMDGSFNAAPDCIASHIYKTKQEIKKKMTFIKSFNSQLHNLVTISDSLPNVCM